MNFISKCFYSTAFLLSLTCVASQQALILDRPNVVVIMVDDMGYADMGVNGCTDIKTPHLDRFAEEGINFTSGYVTHSFCGPSRAGFFAGRYQQRFGHEMNPALDMHNERLGLDPNEKTFVKRLQEAGYHTGGIGKWHLGGSKKQYPLNRGFDYYYGFLDGGHDYFKIDLSSGIHYEAGLIRNKLPATFEGYLTDALTADAVNFIDLNAKTEEPFFLYVGYNAPHSPLQGTKEDLAVHSHIKDEKRRGYAALVYSMDRGVGQILDALDANEIREKTLVVFFSDNGGPQPVTWSEWFDNGSSNGELRGGKSDVYEGGERVVMMASWPGVLEKGVTYDRPVISIDWSRTVVDLAGGDAQSGLPMEGVNVIPFLKGWESADPHDALYWRQWNGREWAVRSGDMKLVGSFDDSSKLQLFDLSKDIGEQNDLAKSHPETVDSLLKKKKKWDADNVEPVFPNTPDYQMIRKEFHIKSTSGISNL